MKPLKEKISITLDCTVLDEVKKLAYHLMGVYDISSLGGGVILGHAEPMLQEFCEKNGIPVVTTMMGVGSMPKRHPYWKFYRHTDLKWDAQAP